MHVRNRPSHGLTFFDISNHTYWDLSGKFDGNALNQTLEMSSLSYVRNNKNHLSIGISSSEDTCFDFSSPHTPAEMIQRYPDEERLHISLGYNKAMILDPALVKKNSSAVKLTSPDKDLNMCMNTDQPVVIFYSAGFLNEETLLSSGPSVPGCALAFEEQALPDPLHLPSASPVLLQPNTEISHFIRWKFNCSRG